MRNMAIIVTTMMLVGPTLAAESATSTVTLSGTATDTCRIPDAPLLTGASFSGGASWSHSTVQIASLTDPATGTVNSADITLTFKDVSCNNHARVSLATTNGGLTLGNVITPASAPGGFLNRVAYTAYASWAGQSTDMLNANVTHIGAFVGNNFTSARRGDVVVGVNVPNGSSNPPLLAGFYGDVLTLRVFINP